MEPLDSSCSNDLSARLSLSVGKHLEYFDGQLVYFDGSTTFTQNKSGSKQSGSKNNHALLRQLCYLKSCEYYITSSNFIIHI